MRRPGSGRSGREAGLGRPGDVGRTSLDAAGWVRPDAAGWARSDADRVGRRDAGNASVEFLAVALVLLVPIVYLVVTLGRIQAGAMAVDLAARQSVRVFVTADPALAAEAATVVTSLALADHGLEAGPTALTLHCTADPCHSPGAAVTAVVEVAVPLPGIPAFLRESVPLEVPVSSRATASMDRYRVWP